MASRPLYKGGDSNITKKEEKINEGESLVGKASQKRKVFRDFLNDRRLLALLMVEGVLFHARGAETEKARGPMVFVWVEGISRVLLDAERRCVLAFMWDTGVNCCAR